MFAIAFAHRFADDSDVPRARLAPRLLTAVRFPSRFQEPTSVLIRRAGRASLQMRFR